MLAEDFQLKASDTFGLICALGRRSRNRAGDDRRDTSTPAEFVSDI